MTTEVFSEIQKLKQASRNRPIDLPIAYHDATNFTAFFRVPQELVMKLIPAKEIKPVIINNDAIIALAFFNYRKCDIDPYQEVGLSVLIQPANKEFSFSQNIRQVLLRKEVGVYIIDLPVTTAEACEYGRTIWGYPKFKTFINVNLKDRLFLGTVYDPNNGLPMISLKGYSGFSFPVMRLNLRILSVLGNTLLSTPVESKNPHHFHVIDNLTLHLSNSDHPMCQRMKFLGLNRKKPWFVLSCTNFQALLHEGTEVSHL